MQYHAYTIEEAINLFSKWRTDQSCLLVYTSNAYRPRRRPRGTPRDYKSFTLAFKGVVGGISGSTVSISGPAKCELQLQLDLKSASIGYTEFEQAPGMLFVSLPGGEPFIFGESAPGTKINLSRVVDWPTTQSSTLH
jgi:hypothetical protein